MDEKTPAKYRTVSIPADFFQQVDDYVKNNPRFRSVADFARTAMYEKLQQERLFPGQKIDLQQAYDDMRAMEKEEQMKQIEKIVDRKISDKLRSLIEKPKIKKG